MGTHLLVFLVIILTLLSNLCLISWFIQKKPRWLFPVPPRKPHPLSHLERRLLKQRIVLSKKI